MYWAAKCVAEFAVEHKKSWERLPRDAAVGLLKGAHSRVRDAKANIGTVVHNAVEEYSTGREPAPLGPIEQGYYAAALRFLNDYEPEPLHVEKTVYSRTHGYAGTSDQFARITLPGESEARNVVIDYKTGKAIYPEYGIQLCTYARADFIAGDDGTEVELPADVDVGISVRLGPAGAYEARVFHLTDDLFALFLAAKVIYERDAVFTAAMGANLPVKAVAA